VTRSSHGFKKLKALCLNGFNKAIIADPKKAGVLTKNYRKKIENRFKSKIAGGISSRVSKFTAPLRIFKLPVYEIGIREFLLTKRITNMEQVLLLQSVQKLEICR